MRNSYETFISNRIFNSLPTAKEWLVVQDLDFIFSNYKKKKFMFLEVKTRNNQLSYPQRAFYSMMHKSLIKTQMHNWREYTWTHLLRFENNNFDDWVVELDWNAITESELIHFFNYELWFTDEVLHTEWSNDCP